LAQLKITLPAFIRDELDRASAKSGKSLAEEIRSRLARTFQQDAMEVPMLELLAAIVRLGDFIKSQSGRAWHADAAARQAFAVAVSARLARLGPADPGGKLEPAEGNMPFVASDDPNVVGLSLEALDYKLPGIDDPRVVAELEKFFPTPIHVRVQPRGFLASSRSPRIEKSQRKEGS
jgi:hypothetical protein